MPRDKRGAITMHFPRPSLADEMCDALQGKSFLSDAPNGVFISAPDPIASSNFLLNALKPKFQNRGVNVIYVDCSAQPACDFGELLANSIANASSIHKHKEIVLSALKHSFTEGLRTINELTHAPIALIIDEAHYSLSSVTGMNAMFALKSARDQINRPNQVNLMLVMVSSDHENLSKLVTGNSAPFFGSTIKKMAF